MDGFLVGAWLPTPVAAAVAIVLLGLVAMALFGGGNDPRDLSRRGGMAGLAVAAGLAFAYAQTTLPPLVLRDGRTAIPKRPEPPVDWRLLSTANGKRVDLSDLNGKVLFINQWATWCKPCVQEMPSLQRLSELLKETPDVAFLFVLQGDEPSNAAEFMRTNGLSLPVYLPMDPPPRELEARALPNTVILGKDRRVRLKLAGAEDWAQSKYVAMLKSLAAEPAPEQPKAVVRPAAPAAPVVVEPKPAPSDL
ncbi:MAG: TlpA family protein disulfide reductase [Planctomycetia bacterium]